MNLILKSPHISEKALKTSSINQFIFDVPKSATKTQIKHAVASFYNVTVTSVNTINYPILKIRSGRRRLPTLSKTFKKAVVTLKVGQTLPIFETKG